MIRVSPNSRIAFIGTRDIAALPEVTVDVYRHAAEAAGRAGTTVVTGAAPGADQLAATLAVSRGGPLELVLPWASFEDKWVRWARAHRGVSIVVYDPLEHPAWLDSVRKYHPAGRKLIGGSLALHARNYGIVYRAELVIALPKSARPDAWGGTGQGMRVARALGIPCLNLHIAGDRAAVERLFAPRAGVGAAPAGPE